MLLDFLTLAAALVTIYYLRKYTIAARDQVAVSEKTAAAAAETARIAVEQVEAIQKPCIVLVQPPDTSDDAVLEEMTSSVLGEETIRFKNIGHGPALNVRYRFRPLSKPSRPLEMTAASETAPLAQGEVADTLYPVSALDLKRAEIVFDYSSLSGTRYRSRAVIVDRRWVGEFRFSKLTCHEPDPPHSPASE